MGMKKKSLESMAVAESRYLRSVGRVYAVLLAVFGVAALVGGVVSLSVAWVAAGGVFVVLGAVAGSVFRALAGLVLLSVSVERPEPGLA